jgi:hypothetical protein
VFAVIALGLIGGPIATWWFHEHGDHSLSRNEADKDREERELGEVGAQDLHCVDVSPHYEFSSVYVEGCGKHVDYIRVGDKWQQKGDIVPLASAHAASANSWGCEATWIAEPDASATDAWKGADGARAAAKQIWARKHTSRVRVPTTETGVTGLQILVVGPTVDQFIDPDAGADVFSSDVTTVPCTVDAGGSRCTVPWRVVAEVAECR